MAYGLTFRLELEDGTPEDPPTLRTSRYRCGGRRHDPLGNGRTLRLVATRRGEEPDGDPMLVAEAD